MKAVRIHSFGGPQNLKIEDLPRPRVKDNEVLIQVHDAGVNPADWKIREGILDAATLFPFPITMGQNCAGLVFEVGEKVTRFKKGDKVFGFTRGSYAEYSVASEDQLAQIPASMNFQTAACLPTAGVTALQMIEEAQVSAGQLVLIHGAAGGVGSMAVQLAKHRRARVVVTAAREDYDYLDSLGIEFFIDYKSQRFEEHVNGVDVVVDLVGGETPLRSLPILKKNGMLISAVNPISADQARDFDVRAVYFQMQPDNRALEELAGFVERKVLQPRLARVLPLMDARRAQEICQSGLSHGKTVLQVLS